MVHPNPRSLLFILIPLLIILLLAAWEPYLLRSSGSGAGVGVLPGDWDGTGTDTLSETRNGTHRGNGGETDTEIGRGTGRNAGTGEPAWSGEIAISNASSYAGTPAVGIDGADNIHVVWEEGAGFFNESRRIHVMRMAPWGEVLMERVIASTTTLDSAWADIAVEANGTAHIVWQDSHPIYRNIFYMAVTPRGENAFSRPIPLVQGFLTGAYTPSVAVDAGGHVHVVWHDLRITLDGARHEIYYTELDPYRAWGRTGLVSDEDIRVIDDTRISSNLVIADVDGLLDTFGYLAGYRGRDCPPFPRVAVDSRGYVSVVWTDSRDGHPEIYYSLLDPSRAARDGSPSHLSVISMVNNSRVTRTDSVSIRPRIAMGPDDTVHCAFTDNMTGSFGVYYGTIPGPGFEGEPVFRKLSGHDPDRDHRTSGLSPVWIDSEGIAYVSWREGSPGAGGVRMSTIGPDGAILWDRLPVTTSGSVAGCPPVVVDSNANPVVIWQDDRTSVYQIYYNRTVMFPDLSVGRDDIRSTALAGEEGWLEVTVRNLGNRRAVSQMSVRTGDHHWITEVDVDADGDRICLFAWAPEAGTHTVTVHLDPGNDLTETSKGNNHMVGTLTILSPPMIRVSRAELGYGGVYTDVLTLPPGREIMHFQRAPREVCWFNLSLSNTGGCPSGPFHILLTGTHESEGMEPLVIKTPVDLAHGAEETLSFVLDTDEGLWRYRVTVDSGNALAGGWKEMSIIEFPVIFDTTPDPSINWLRLRGDGIEGRKHEILVSLVNDGATPAAGTLEVFIDGTRVSGRAVVLDPHSERIEGFSWRPERGLRNVTVVLLAEPDSSPGNNRASMEVTIDAPGMDPRIPLLVAGCSVLGLIAFLSVFTESGKFAFARIMVVPLIPLYTRLKRGKVLDHFMRGQVYGFIKANPGAHYNLIRRQLDINNGALAYHIAVLEREKFIRSRIDGTLKRFYPSGMNLPSGHELTDMERKILGIIKANPGFSQKEVAFTLGLSPQVINYHIKSLAKERFLMLTRVGKRTLCYLNDEVELDS